MFNRIVRGVAPVIAMAAALGAGACDGNVMINGDKGVPLSELDTAGKTPTWIVLAGPDSVVVKDGGALSIDVSGDPQAVESLRFTLDDDTLGIMRKNGSNDRGKATVTVTMPGLEKLTLAGSGSIEAASLAGKPEVVIAGSGTVRTARVAASKLEVTIAGSGTYRAAGTADALELTVAGSGTADMAGLNAKTAEVTIAGSGDAAFASDGTVEATIMGSGDVTVNGSARCTIKSMGSGTLTCERGTIRDDARGAGNSGETPPVAPTPPPAPSAPATPE
jgi:hypothetical protein